MTREIELFPPALYEIPGHNLYGMLPPLIKEYPDLPLQVVRIHQSINGALYLWAEWHHWNNKTVVGLKMRQFRVLLVVLRVACCSSLDGMSRGRNIPAIPRQP